MSQAIHEWRHAGYYVVDDWGMSAQGDAVRGMMDRFVDYRWARADAGLRSLFTTNLAPADFGPRIASRLLDTRRVKALAIKADDYRRKQ